MTSGPGGVGQQHSEPLHPPEHGDVVDLDTTLNQEFLDVAVGQVVAQVPAHRDDDRLGWEPEPDERRLWGCQGPWGSLDTFTGQACRDLANAQRNGARRGRAETVVAHSVSSERLTVSREAPHGTGVASSSRS